MGNNFFSSDRKFIFFDMKASHGQFLLRSTKNDLYSSNIDVIFFDTSYIQLFYALNEITISRADEICNNYKALQDKLKLGKNKLFQIESQGEIYFVAAAFVKVFKNELEFNESSLGFSNKGREVEVATSL